MAADTGDLAGMVNRFILLTDIAESSRLTEAYPEQYYTALHKDVMRLQDELECEREEVDSIRAQYDKVVARLLRQLEELEQS